MPGVKLVFDIAGTIIEDHGEVISAFCAALEKNGLHATPTELMEFKGASKREVIAHFVERQWGEDSEQEARIAKTYQDFRANLESRYSNGE
jgi:phosphoglycolate phosphatase